MAIRKLENGENVLWNQSTGATKSVTFAQIIEAMALSNYDQGFGYLLKDDEKGHIVNACAVGQCALNLGVSTDDLQAILEDEFADSLYIANDTEHKTPKQIARRVKSFWKNRLDEKVELRAYNYAEFSNWKGVIVGK